MNGIKRCRKFAFGGKSLKKTLIWQVFGLAYEKVSESKKQWKLLNEKGNKTKSKLY
jgi:hypothetical protein